MQKLIFTLMIVLATFAALPVMAGDLIDTKIALGIDYIHGDTTYKIGGNVNSAADGIETKHFPVSELRFPMEVFIASANVDITVAKRVAMILHAGTSFTDETKDMQDSDWGEEPYPPELLTTYSRSKTSMDALVLSGKIRYRLYTNPLSELASHTREDYDLSFWAGLGYLHEEFEFKSKDTYQTSLVPGTIEGLFPGPTLTYDITYTVPYVELAATLDVDNKAEMTLSTGYSSYAEAEDIDKHLLKNWVSRGDCEGTATLVSFKSRFSITEHWFTGFHIDYRHIETEGESVTHENGEWHSTVDEKTKSESTIMGVTFGCNF